jgi:hypothetical protein
VVVRVNKDINDNDDNENEKIKKKLIKIENLFK